ncbi:hypothetical protein [Pseudoruegeria sp. HB172150]|uniref:hypothetical protein n=1 Tax=Pseudoruegeria sp. HB172150 TaxID=2721164 RepID=UPI001558023A|nr:hypothetical protein [Pseudoruegeria sp. HB172150]
MITQADPQAVEGLSAGEIDRRITFHPETETMEVDFSGLHFETSAQVNAFYDRIEDRIDDSGENLWFFLVIYSGNRIDPDAWFAHARRGKTLNLAHSMGTVRVDASDETRLQIERAAGTEAFDANLFAERDSAIRRLAELPSKRRQKITHEPNHSTEEIARRVRFLEADQILEIDLSKFLLEHDRDVDDLYDHLEMRIEATSQRWYFLINYNDTRIMPEAWIQFARRGKILNLGGSLGTVRYEAGTDTEADIRLRAESQGFRPNIRNSRDAALARIEEIKRGG